MPTYDYACRSCDHRFEEFQSMSAKALKKCPACGERSLERLIGVGAGIIFKGGGFYETDYRSESYKKGAEAEKKAAEPAKSDAGSCACGAKPKAECAGSTGAQVTTKGASPKSEPKKSPSKHAPASA